MNSAYLDRLQLRRIILEAKSSAAPAKVVKWNEEETPPKSGWDHRRGIGGIPRREGGRKEEIKEEGAASSKNTFTWDQKTFLCK